MHLEKLFPHLLNAQSIHRFLQFEGGAFIKGGVTKNKEHDKLLRQFRCSYFGIFCHFPNKKMVINSEISWLISARIKSLIEPILLFVICIHA